MQVTRGHLTGPNALYARGDVRFDPAYSRQWSSGVRELWTYRKVETVSSWLGPEHMGNLGEVRCTDDSETLRKVITSPVSNFVPEHFLTSIS